MSGAATGSVEMGCKRIKSNRFSVCSKFLVRASYMQIYNETISDLLKEGQGNLVIREDSRRGVFVDGLSEWVVRSAAEVYGLMERGTGMVRLRAEFVFKNQLPISNT